MRNVSDKQQPIRQEDNPQMKANLSSKIFSQPFAAARKQEQVFNTENIIGINQLPWLLVFRVSFLACLRLFGTA